METDPGFSAGHSEAVVRAFRKRMQLIRAARDERDLRALKSLRLERLKGKRKNQSSLRLNNQWRLVVEIRESPTGKEVVVVEITDYH